MEAGSVTTSRIMSRPPHRAQTRRSTSKVRSSGIETEDRGFASTPMTGSETWRRVPAVVGVSGVESPKPISRTVFPAFTVGQIDSYLAALAPYAKTPYRFVTVGRDFQHPKPRLIEYLDGYNQRHYDATGVWAVAASFEDYET
jgi:hypothetical protein